MTTPRVETPAIEPAPDDGDLTRFQWDLLYVLAASNGQSDYGLGIKRKLEAYYGDEVNHGRLYPNLDDLIDARLVTKSELDQRTNEYALADAGVDLVIEDADQRATIADLLRGDD